MPSAAWTYSDWVTFESGSATRLSRLRSHIKEVSDYIQTGGYTVQGRSHTKAELVDYLETLIRLEKDEAAITAAAVGTSRAFWTKGRFL